MKRSHSYPKHPICMTMVLATLSMLSPTLHAQSTLVTVTEDPDQVNSSLSNTEVYTFDNLQLGFNNNVNWGNVGTFDSLYVKNPNQWGGAPDSSSPNGTQYSVQGIGKLPTTTLQLNTPSSYFGFWWSAGDGGNILRFYNSDTMLAQFTTSTLTGLLPSDYYGNPINRNRASHEPFAFINFYGDEETAWDRIEFTNKNMNSGFESDNYTSRVVSFDPTVDSTEDIGTVVAEVTDGTTTTQTSETPQGWTWGAGNAAPGAPAPPVYLAAIFGLVLLFKNHFRKAKSHT